MVRRIDHKSGGARGFTLVELLVVLAIIAFTAGIVVVNVAPTRGEARAAAEQFAAKLNAADEHAIMTNSFLGLVIEPGRYEILEYEAGAWSEIENSSVFKSVVPQNTGFQFELPEDVKRNEEIARDGGLDDEKSPVVFFSPTGQTTPFKAEFTSARKRIVVTMDGAGGISIIEND